jgi:hypothetical protein
MKPDMIEKMELVKMSERTGLGFVTEKFLPSTSVLFGLCVNMNNSVSCG